MGCLCVLLWQRGICVNTLGCRIKNDGAKVLLFFTKRNRCYDNFNRGMNFCKIEVVGNK